MSVVIPVSADWLTLREGADASARSRRLAEHAARLVSAPLTVHDLGSGTGSMMRWLSPLLPAPQTWVLHDWNAELLGHAAQTRPRGTKVRTRVGALGDLEAADLEAADPEGDSLVVTSALLDVLTAAEVEAVVGACLAARVPALFALSVTGEVSLDPVDPGDRVFEAAFNDHQRRVAEDRRLLGPDAVDLAAGLFQAAGWSVQLDESPWRLDGRDRDRDLVVEWLDGWLAAAVDERPALREWAAEYARARRDQLARGVLRVEVAHRDLLAWPP